MIRVPKDKSIDINVPYRMFNDTGLLVTEDEIWVRADEALYNRLKSSYDSGKFKSMNDDESLKDLCEEYAAKARKARWQEFVFDYPEDIVRGLTFEENSAAQWDEEKFQEMMDEIMPGILAEDVGVRRADVEPGAGSAFASERIRIDDFRVSRVARPRDAGESLGGGVGEGKLGDEGEGGERGMLNAEC